MAIDKAVDSALLDTALEATATAIKTKTGGSSPLPFDLSGGTGFAEAISAIITGGGMPPWIKDVAGGIIDGGDSPARIEISINMKAAPKLFAIWTQPLATPENNICEALVVQKFYDSDVAEELFVGYGSTLNRSTAATHLTSGFELTATKIAVTTMYNNQKRLKDADYKWVAIAF